uniref:Secreted protein n=1 Tax=Ixodes ricinus TaxID=34613 RepID=A0A6B0UDB5_IXORI
MKLALAGFSWIVRFLAGSSRDQFHNPAAGRLIFTGETLNIMVVSRFSYKKALWLKVPLFNMLSSGTIPHCEKSLQAKVSHTNFVPEKKKKDA